MTINDQVFGQQYVKEFIRTEVIGRLEFNRYATSGSHATYIVNAAKDAGLLVRKIGVNHYFFRDGRCVGAIDGMVTSLVSHTAIKASRSKYATKELLQSAGIPVPRGRMFPAEHLSKGRQFFRELQEPVVVKPDAGGGGVGITCGVTTEQHFVESWKKAASTMKSSPTVLVEEFNSGIDLRVFVAQGRVVAAATRLPAHVVGDGVSSLADLVSRKQATRDLNKRLATMPIIVDSDWLSSSGLAMDSVLDDGEIAVVNSAANLHQGGESVNVTPMLHPDIEKLAVDTLNAIPGMEAGGVDFVARSPRIAEGAVVLEVNTSANISIHHLPVYGAPVDVGRGIIEAMISASSCTELR